MEHFGAGFEGRELQVIDFLERETGLEPATSSLGNYHFVCKYNSDAFRALDGLVRLL
jgi:hypothetical protein